MKRTSVGVLVGAGVLGLIIGFGVDQLLTANARPTLTPAITLPIAELVIAAAVLALAWPIRRAVRSSHAARIDPFRAVRTAVLARASSILGAALAGFAVGLLAFLLSRPVPAQVGSIMVVVFTAVASVVLVGAALIAESFCTLPKDDDDDADGTDGTAGALQGG